MRSPATHPEHFGDAAAVLSGDEHAARAAVDVAELDAGLADGGGVDLERGAANASGAGRADRGRARSGRLCRTMGMISCVWLMRRRKKRSSRWSCAGRSDHTGRATPSPRRWEQQCESHLELGEVEVLLKGGGLAAQEVEFARYLQVVVLDGGRKQAGDAPLHPLVCRICDSLERRTARPGKHGVAGDGVSFGESCPSGPVPCL